MSDEPALLAAVVAAPDDDLPRLVYADWCDENGDPLRAEFIRIQCALARPDEFTRTRLTDLRIREKVLLGGHAERWLEPLRRKGEPLFSRRTHGQFRRGFVEVVWMPAVWFVRKGDKLFARCPVRELRVTQATRDEYRTLLDTGGVTRLEVLDLSDRKLGNTATAALTAVARGRGMGRLNRLRLRACEIDDTGADALADLTADLFTPSEIDVSLNPISERGVGRLRERYGPAVRFD